MVHARDHDSPIPLLGPGANKEHFALEVDRSC